MTEQEPIELEGVTFVPGRPPRAEGLEVGEGRQSPIRLAPGGADDARAWDVDLPSGRTVRWMRHKAPGGAARWVLVDVSRTERADPPKAPGPTVGDLVARYVAGEDLSVAELEQFHALVRSGRIRLQVAVPAP